MERGAGILAHVTTVGGFRVEGGLGARAFVDFLARSGVRYWQVLAFGPTGFGDSPYAPVSVFAMNPSFIRKEIAEGVTPSAPPAVVGEGDFQTITTRGVEGIIPSTDSILNYATFAAIKAAKGGRAWSDWGEMADPKSAATTEFIKTHAEEINKIIAEQTNLMREWLEIKKYANGRGVKVIGDLPIYPAMDSADVWANRDQFDFADKLNPRFVAGVGPDYFNADGQLWGNPVYDFRQMAADKFKWWISRLKQAEMMFDVIRIDHFRAFDSYYQIPAGEKSAKNGTWTKGPGIKFFNAIQKALPNIKIILEDLGEITPGVKALRDAVGFPGMRVLQFGFDGSKENEHLPENYISNCVAYTGTHDNDTLVGFVKGLTKAQREIVDDVLESSFLTAEDTAKLALESVLHSAANVVVVPIQDFLLLDSRARMNTPGTILGSNWKYRLAAGDLTDEVSSYVKSLLERSGRL